MVHIHLTSGKVIHTSTCNGEVDDLMKDSNEMIAVIDVNDDERIYTIVKDKIEVVEYTK